jgi:polyphosphate glucokinase
MVRAVRRRFPVASYDAVTIGYPGPVRRGKILQEPYHLAKGWVDFDFRKSLGRPVRIINDAAMQALGSYEGGRMLFLGLGTGLGSAMIVEGKLAPMELAHLPFKKGRTFEEFVGEEALDRMGRKRWRREVLRAVGMLTTALEPDYVVVGGGNLRKLDSLPNGARPGDNENAFLGGVRAWGEHRGSEHGSPAAPADRRRRRTGSS